MVVAIPPDSRHVPSVSSGGSSSSVYARFCIRICSATVRIPHGSLLPSLPTTSQVPDVDPEEALQCARRALLTRLRQPDTENSTTRTATGTENSTTRGGRDASSRGFVFIASTSEAVRLRAREMFAKRCFFSLLHYSQACS